MKKLTVLALLTLTAVTFTACQKKGETEPATQTAQNDTTAALETDSELESGSFTVNNTEDQSSKRETPNAQGQVHSYLTGALTDVNLAYKRPIAIMLNNIIDACPQAGIARAGIVYEAPVEGGLTRLMGIFEDYKDMEKIGSVRSCRDYYVRYALEFDAIYTHFGQAVYAFDLLNSDRVNNISGLEYQEKAGKLKGYAGEDIFYRSSDRPSPHNVYISEEGINKAIENKGYSTELADDYTGHYKFAKDGEEITYTDGSAQHMEPAYQINKPWFDYNTEDKLYYRSQYKKEQIDQLTDEQLAYKNVIFQYSQVENYDDNGYLNIDTKSGGNAIVFSDGTYQKGTWKKDDEWGPAKYYDASGKEIVLNQGKTWVCIVPKNYESNVVIQ